MIESSVMQEYIGEFIITSFIILPDIKDFFFKQSSEAQLWKQKKGV